VENADWLNALARVGLVAKGASFALVGILAIKLAFESGGKATSRQGALQSLAQQSFGKFLLIVLAAGFAAYALWRFAQTFFDKNDVGDGAKGLAKPSSRRTKRRTRRPRPCSPGPRARGSSAPPASC